MAVSESRSVDEVLTPYSLAYDELLRRQQNSDLKRDVADYLGDDIPEYFATGPALYLARHLATPNFETLRFLHLAESLGLPVVLGQDTNDKFAPHNPLKKALGKMPICLEISQKGGVIVERFQKVAVVDFNSANGRRLSEIETVWGESLPAFHARLLAPYVRGHVRVVDDALWIDRNHRGDLLAHYKRFLALFIAHGILFEDYWTDDTHEGVFLETVLHPAFDFVKELFGVPPLITHLTPTSGESREFWLSYPRGVLDVIQSSQSV